MFTIILYGFGMICMELTWTDTIFSRTTVVLFFVQKSKSSNTVKLFVDVYGPKYHQWARAAHGGALRGAQPTRRAWGPRRTLVGCAPSGHTPGAALAH